MRDNQGKISKANWISVIVVVLIAASAGWISHRAWAQAPGQRTFPSAQAAVNALVSAIQSNDEQALSAILGADGKDMLKCGDQDQDSADRQAFVQKYQEMHRLVMEPDGTTTLYVGAENWPFPFPLVQKNGSWYFDSEAGKNEVLARTIGEDELTAIAVSQELADAEKEYYKAAHDGGSGDQYASKIDSDSGIQDGLYWQSSPSSSSDQAQSPIGPAVGAAASPDDSKTSGTTAEPFQGYYFLILQSQGDHAPGGAHAYADNDGKMTHGFAILAYPAKYGSTGVMTFIVGDDGTVYQKDLGPNTNAAAKSMTQYDPDSSWQKVE